MRLLKRLQSVLVVSLIASAVIGVGAALGWHANGVTVHAACDQEHEVFTISATIDQSSQWPDASVLSITPSSFPGDSTGVQPVVVKIGWSDSNDTQTFAKTVQLGGDCVAPHPDPEGTLTVIKRVVNDDSGEASSGDWTMNVSGPTSLSFAGAGDPGTSNTVAPGDYSISESGGPSGYSLSYSGDCDGQGHVTVAPFHNSTCILTNDDEEHEDPTGALTVIKRVVNDDGGEASSDDWTMHVSGPTSLSFPGASDPGTTNTVVAGDYTVTESSSPSGYSLSYSGDCDGHGRVTVAPAHKLTCILTNDDEEHEEPTGTLTVIKRVINDDGGEASSDDWTMHVSGPTSLSFAGASDPGTTNTVFAGDYLVTESSSPSGYSLSYSGDCDGEGNVTVAPFHNPTCILTNDDEEQVHPPGTLIVRKVVINDNGGTATAHNFSFSVNGSEPQAFEADGENVLVVEPGVYSVSEPAVGGYTTTYDHCDHLSISEGGSATCTITNNDVARGVGSIQVSKSADPTSLKEPGGLVTYSVRITNTSVDLGVLITNVVDDKFGDLDDDGGSGCFDVPINIPPGGFSSCQFQKQITGAGGTSHVNTVTASGQDEAGHLVSGSDDARVDITPRLIDLVIQKNATSPTPLHGTVTYTMTVENRGPDTATNVQLADPAPAGVTYLSANPSQGTCAVTPALVTCSLGTIAPGHKVTIIVTGRATLTGRHVNTATVTGEGGRETNPADNVDSAETIVPAPLTPPTAKPKPKPKPKPNICLTLTVTPTMITADGKPDLVKITVSAKNKRVSGAKVLVTGPGVRKSGRTNRQGVALIRINPKTSGIVAVTTLEKQRTCGQKRVGVAGIFLPPLAG